MRTQLLVAVFLGCQLAAAQQPNTQQPTAQPDFRPLVAIQEEDYAKARQHFQTTLLRSGPAPQKWSPVSPPAGVIEVEYPSGPLKLKAWVNQPDSSKKKYPAVLFLHGGHSFSIGDWEMSQPYRDAGFVVLTPLLRGENGQPGNFTMYYDEVADVLAAADYLRRLPYIDPSRVFVAGHSVGGTMTMLAALSYEHFRGAASLSGSPDQVLYVKYAPGAKDRAPFDYTNARELEMRSPLAFAAFFKCPLRIYYGSQEPQFELTSQRTAQIAMDRGMDVEVVRVEGNHMSHVPESVKASVEFFRQIGAVNR